MLIAEPHFRVNEQVEYRHKGNEQCLPGMGGNEMVVVHNGTPISMQDNCGTKAEEHYTGSS